MPHPTRRANLRSLRSLRPAGHGQRVRQGTVREYCPHEAIEIVHSRSEGEMRSGREPAVARTVSKARDEVHSASRRFREPVNGDSLSRELHSGVISSREP